MEIAIIYLCIFSLFITNLICVYSMEREITISIDAGKKDCFFENVKQGEVIDLEYQVIDGGHGDLDISFVVSEPNGRLIHVDFKKSENNYRIEAAHTGDYKFCFDNTFSAYNAKTVFFELLIETDEDEWDDEKIDFNKLDKAATEEMYDLQMQDIHDIIMKVRNHLIKVRQLQEFFKSYEARDRNIAEENFFKVNSFSFLQVIIMVTVGIVQVIMLKSLFDDTSKVHKMWKKLDHAR